MRRLRRRLAAIALAGTLVAALAVIPTLRPRCSEVSGIDRISIPISRLAKGAIEFFCYRDQAGDRLRFILARDEAGQVHSVMDSCHQCGEFHKGYTYSKGELICRLCGNRYQIAHMEIGKASCVPIALPISQHGELVEVKVADLMHAERHF